MKQIIILVAMAAMLASCDDKKTQPKQQIGQESTAVMPVTDSASGAPATASASGITVNEQAGLKEISSFYGGKVTYTIGANKDGSKYFRVEISNSGSLDSTKQIAELNISNIALMFYKDLRQERSVYHEIRAVVRYGDGQKLVKTYLVEKLEIALSKMMVVQHIAQLLKDKRYDDLAPLLNDQTPIATYSKSDLIAKIKRAEPSLGNVKDFIPYGFMFIKDKNKHHVLHISGVLVRDSQNNEFSVDFDATSTKDEAVFLNYKL